MLGPKQKAWVDALRENPEQQGKYKLGNTHRNEYCCLGKLVVMQPEERHSELFKVDSKGYIQELRLPRSALVLPVELQEEYHFRNSEAKLALPVPHKNSIYTRKRFANITSHSETFDSLAMLNDSGATWLEIADFIEANPGNVFTKFV